MKVAGEVKWIGEARGKGRIKIGDEFFDYENKYGIATGDLVFARVENGKVMYIEKIDKLYGLETAVSEENAFVIRNAVELAESSSGSADVVETFKKAVKAIREALKQNENTDG